MPDGQGRLYAEDVAADLGISPKTWRAYVSREQAPAADDRVIDGRHVRPVWEPGTVAAYRSRSNEPTGDNTEQNTGVGPDSAETGVTT